MRPQQTPSPALVEFKPYKRKDDRYAIEVFVNGESNGWIHWIEPGLPENNYKMRICRVSNPDMTMYGIPFEDECIGNCNWLKSKYDDGEIK